MSAPDVILSRECRIEPIGGGEAGPLLVQFLRPTRAGPDEVLLPLRLSCAYFERRSSLTLADEIQALSCGLNVALAELHAKVREGYRIYWRTPGDLNHFDFWGYTEGPSEFSPPLAHKMAAYDRGDDDPARIVMPSHRVSVNQADDTVSIHRISADGSDRLVRSLTPEDLRRRDPAGPARALGALVLSDTAIGRRIMASTA